MIIVIDALNADKFSDILDEVYKLRARVFNERLGWQVDVTDGREIDAYDKMDPATIVSLDEDGDVVGCMRLLQTTGPHMLADIFYEILDGEPPIRASNVWEATRFCIDTNKLKGTKKTNSISHYTSEVMIGGFEYARDAGILDFVAVIDPVMNRVMKRSGNAPYDYLGSMKPMGIVNAMAALMDCSNERINSIRQHAGIDYDVFMSDDQALDLFAMGQFKKSIGEGMPLEMAMNGSSTAKTEDLQRYCYEQMLNANDPRETEAAFELIKLLGAKIGAETPSDLQRIAHQLSSRSVRQDSHA